VANALADGSASSCAINQAWFVPRSLSGGLGGEDASIPGRESGVKKSYLITPKPQPGLGASAASEAFTLGRGAESCTHSLKRRLNR